MRFFSTIIFKQIVMQHAGGKLEKIKQCCHNTPDHFPVLEDKIVIGHIRSFCSRI